MSNDTPKGPKPVTIYINTRPHEVPKDDLSFAAIAELAYPGQTGGENIFFTITYRRGAGNKPEGSLVEDETVEVKEGMTFNVVRTDKS